MGMFMQNPKRIDHRERTLGLAPLRLENAGSTTAYRSVDCLQHTRQECQFSLLIKHIR